MSGNIVQKDDLTLLQSWSKDLFDISQEVGAVHWAIQHKRGGDAIIAEPAYESCCFPVAVWHLIDEPFSLRSPASDDGPSQTMPRAPGPSSESRQGRKARGVGHPAQRALWGFGWGRRWSERPLGPRGLRRRGPSGQTMAAMSLMEWDSRKE